MTRRAIMSHCGGSPSHRGLLLCFLLSLLLPVHVAAQGTPPDSGASVAPGTDLPHDPGFTRIMLIARADRDSVVLRWAPGTPHGWRVANRTGYVVERKTGNGDFARITPDTLHPWLPPQFIEAMKHHKDNAYMGMVLNALWADSILLDAGGADTLGENAERNTTMFGYALFAADNDPSIAEAMGLRFVDRHVKVGSQYTYRVRLNEGRDYRIDPGEVSVEVRAVAKNPSPTNLVAIGMDRRIELRWEPQHGPEYTGYLVSRSEDGGKTFKQLHERPIVIVVSSDTAVHPQGGFTDTSVINYKVYRYRVRGITAFGEHGTAAEVRAYAHDLTPPPAPLVKSPKQIGKHSVEIAWEMPAACRDLSGFMVSRSAYSDSNYHDIVKKRLPKSVRQYTDAAASEAEPYYIITAIDTAGNKAPSFPLLSTMIDTVPPAVPSGLRGTIDSAGVIHLAWHRNSERNLAGYRILRANAPDHEFTQLKGEVWPDTTFVDTVDVHTLTREVYYRIAAVNLRFNHSAASVPLVIHRPDMIPPEAPVFSDVMATDSTVLLRWAPSGSSDVQSHVLSRRTSTKEPWTVLATLSREASSYVDRAVAQNVMYEYRIEAVDSTGLRSPARLTVDGRPFDSGLRPAVANLTAEFNSKNRTVILHWSYDPEKHEKLFFVIYRAQSGSPLRSYRSVGGEQKSFIDTGFSGPSAYEYAIKVTTRDGAESALSAVVRVQVPSGK